EEMVSKKIIIAVVVVVALLVIAAIVIPTTIVLTKRKNDNNEENKKPNFETLFAQTHVIPAQGLKWNLTGTDSALHLVGNRLTMLMIKPIKMKLDPDAPPPYVAFFTPNATWTVNNTEHVEYATSIQLNPPSTLPSVESNGTAIYENTYWLNIPAQYVVPGVKIVVNNKTSDAVYPLVGWNSTFILDLLPFYMFGANDTNSIPYSKASNVTEFTYDSIYQTWPVSKLIIKNHDIGIMSLPSMIISSNGARPAYKLTGAAQLKDGYDMMGEILGILSGLRAANGDGSLNYMMYVPLVAMNQTGAPNRYSGPGGGLGSVGGGVCVGDSSYSGIFIHEMGHAFGLPHAGEAYPEGYPYVNGSLLGSQPGFDFLSNNFMSIYAPTNSSYYSTCKKSAVIDDGKCVRQDPMQGGAGYQVRGKPFTMFADYNIGRMQIWQGTNIVYDEANDKYLFWNNIELRYDEYIITNNSKNSMDSGFPYIRNRPMYTIMMHLITADTSPCTDCSIIYPVFKRIGNLRRWIDPRDQSQLDLIVPNRGTFPWWCHGSGCDYTMRVTYADGSMWVKLLQTGLRKSNTPMSPDIYESYTNPTSGYSTKFIVENCPGDKVLKKVELLWTPYGYNTTMPANPKVIMSQAY
ncbi:hypothetical protein SAMD00019534_072140, partial [Acytostelium subglobosum LB1]|uniref:hypothetical protein n=1 Tax=Acytostelium subglobosum LB1 TaxID=1410327 RepID=UPI000644A690